MSDLLVQVLPNGHLVMPPEFRDLVCRTRSFAVTEQDGSLLLTPISPPKAEMQEDLLSPVLEQQAAQKHEEISRWLSARRLTEESKSRALRLIGLLSDKGIPSDASEDFRDYLYRTRR